MALKSEECLFSAAIESAHIFNAVAASCAATSGLLEALPDFADVAEVMRRMRFVGGKAESVAALLDVLVDTRLCEVREERDRRVYRAISPLSTEQLSVGAGVLIHETRSDLLEPWFGDAHVRTIRDANVALLGRDLRFFRSDHAKIRFDRDFLDAWKINLSNPLYDFGRIIAVREMAERGRRFLDLACGLGYGVESLAQMAPGCTVLAVDKSPDMLAEARRATYPGATVRFVRHDLNLGLPPVRAGSIDGVLFNGSFHFIKDKAARLDEIARALRPGGLLVIGHCFSFSGFADEAMHRFYFAMLEDESYPVAFDRLKQMVAAAGFSPAKTYHRGSHSYLLAERNATPSAACGVAS